MKLEYTPDLSQLDVVKTIDDIHEEYLFGGHPQIYLPDFKDYKADIWAHFLDYFDIKYGEVIDQDGGEYDSQPKSLSVDGKMNIGYTFFNIEIEGYEMIPDLYLDIEGYVVREDGSCYLYPTKIEWDDNLFIKL